MLIITPCDSSEIHQNVTSAFVEDAHLLDLLYSVKCIHACNENWTVYTDMSVHISVNVCAKIWYLHCLERVCDLSSLWPEQLLCNCKVTVSLRCWACGSLLCILPGVTGNWFHFQQQHVCSTGRKLNILISLRMGLQVAVSATAFVLIALSKLPAINSFRGLRSQTSQEHPSTQQGFAPTPSEIVMAPPPPFSPPPLQCPTPPPPHTFHSLLPPPTVYTSENVCPVLGWALDAAFTLRCARECLFDACVCTFCIYAWIEILYISPEKGLIYKKSFEMCILFIMEFDGPRGDPA